MMAPSCKFGFPNFIVVVAKKKGDGTLQTVLGSPLFSDAQALAQCLCELALCSCTGCTMHITRIELWTLFVCSQ